MSYEPTPADKFTFGLWTVGNRGRDPFGDFVRPPLDPVAAVQRLGGDRRLGRELPRQRSGADRRRRGRARSHRPRLQEGARRHRHGRADGDDEPLHRSGVQGRRVHIARPARPRYAMQKTMRAMDLGVELGAKTYVFWGGREGAEVDAAKDPIDAIKRFREAIDFLCEYARDQRYDFRFALEAKPNEPRGDIYFPTTAAYLGVHPDARPSGDGRRQPGGRARAHGRPQLLPCRRAGARGGQAVPHRSERPEAGPVRPGFAVRLRVNQGAVLPRQAARGVRLRRPAPLRRPCATGPKTRTACGTSRAAACGRT